MKEKNIDSLNRLIGIRSSELYYIKNALNNLRVVFDIQIKDEDISNLVRDETRSSIRTLASRKEQIEHEVLHLEKKVRSEQVI